MECQAALPLILCDLETTGFSHQMQACANFSGSVAPAPDIEQDENHS